MLSPECVQPCSEQGQLMEMLAKCPEIPGGERHYLTMTKWMYIHI